MSYEDLDTQNISSFTRKAYLNYSMYVILDRALPHISDGLKPVQRRIIYAMSEIGLISSSKPKKSARTVGDVLGKFHPHGDSACYEAMVLMAQDFSYRYPLIDGQGNWGSIDDPKSFAAMRYTESKLSSYSSLLLAELKQGTVKWVENFDGTLKEPDSLPSKVPNILLNGSSGIAVGMSTDVPPHNMTEVLNACIALMRDPNMEIAQLMDIMPAPDFPGGCSIVSAYNDRIKAYTTGNGSLRLRAIYKVEGDCITITHLPHQVSSSKVLEQIANQIKNKKLPWINDLRDESDFEHKVRIVIYLKSKNIGPNVIMDHLYSTTDLEKTQRINLNIIGRNSKPKVFSIKEVLIEWLGHRKDIVVMRIQHNLSRINDRIHTLKGYMVAFLNIEEVLSIIRTQDNPKEKLIERFKLTDIQVDAILNLKLRNLARLEELQIKKELSILIKDKTKFEEILLSKVKLKNFIIKEFKQIISNYGDIRKSQIMYKPQGCTISEESLHPIEKLTVVISRLGWVKSIKGHGLDLITHAYRHGDSYCDSSEGLSSDMTLFFDSKGKVYSVLSSIIPTGRGVGEPITGKLKLSEGAQIENILCGNTNDYVVICSSVGIGFISSFNYMVSKSKSGKLVTKLGADVKIIKPKRIAEIDADNYIILITNQGRCLIIPLKSLPLMDKGKGIKLINMPKSNITGEALLHIELITLGDVIKIYSGKRYMRITKKEFDIYLGKRSERGVLLPRGYQTVSSLIIEKNLKKTKVLIDNR